MKTRIAKSVCRNAPLIQHGVLERGAPFSWMRAKAVHQITVRFSNTIDDEPSKYRKNIIDVFFDFIR